MPTWAIKLDNRRKRVRQDCIWIINDTQIAKKENNTQLYKILHILTLGNFH